MIIKSRVFLIASAFFFSTTFVAINSSEAATQRINYYIDGDCSDYYDENGEYAFFEEEPDWSCYITVKVTGTKPARTVRLQYWNGKKWMQESSSVTGSDGYAELDFDPTCNSGNYCDGTWKYRVYVDKASGQKSNISVTFNVTFYPGTQDDYDDSGY
jgi:hypothetical protein